jgi:hypothetical protein
MAKAYGASIGLWASEVAELAEQFAQARAEGAASRDAEVQQLRERVAELEAALSALRDEVSAGIGDHGMEELKPLIHHDAVLQADAALAQKGGE